MVAADSMVVAEALTVGASLEADAASVEAPAEDLAVAADPSAEALEGLVAQAVPMEGEAFEAVARRGWGAMAVRGHSRGPQRDGPARQWAHGDLAAPGGLAVRAMPLQTADGIRSLQEQGASAVRTPQHPTAAVRLASGIRLRAIEDSREDR